MKEMLERLAARKCWCDDEEFMVEDYAAGNVEDAYDGGCDDGKSLLARNLLVSFKLDEVSQLNDQIAALKAERELWKDRAVAVASHLDYEVLCGDIQQWVKQFRAGNQRQAEKIKRLLEGLKGLANHVVGEGGDSDNMRQEAQDIINQEEEKA